MTKNESTSGGTVWRKRAVATVGVAAVIASGSVALATSADAAATAPTLTVTAPAKLANDGSSSVLRIEVNNSGTGNDAIPPAGSPTAVLGLNVTIPTGLNCALVTFSAAAGVSTPAAANPPPALAYQAALSSGSNCVFASTFTQPANSDYVYAYNFGVAALPGQTGATGSITTQPFIDTVSAGGDISVIATGNTATTTLGNPAAATVGTTPPSALIYQAYSATVFSDTGTPSTPAVGQDTVTGAGTTASPATAPAGYRVFQAPTNKKSDGTYDNGQYLTATTVPNTVSYGTAAGDAAFQLPGSTYADNTCFYFDTVTAKIINGTGNCDQPNTTTDATPEFTYTIIANNGRFGLAAPGSAGTAGGSTARPTPTLATHDVAGAPFTLPVLFSDVTVGSTFGKDIYSLSDTGAIKGFADGTYRPGVAVTRAQFVNILVNYDPNNAFGNPITGTGECTTIEPSAFSDVPNSSIFCEAIKTLAQFNVINGTGNGKFSPNAAIKRQEMAAILYRFSSVEKTGNVLNGDAKFTAPSPFSDVSASNVFAGDIEWAAKNGIAKGYTDGTYRPFNSTTRDATAALINRTGLNL